MEHHGYHSADPPSACQNIKATFVGSQSLVVQWERPLATDGSNFSYLLEYSDGASVKFHEVVNHSQVVSQVITGLKPATEYIIKVTVVGAVSDENDFRRRCELTASTLDSGNSLKLQKL